VCARGGKIRSDYRQRSLAHGFQYKNNNISLPKKPPWPGARKNARSPSHSPGAAAAGGKHSRRLTAAGAQRSAGSKAHLCMCGYHTVTP